MVGFDERIQPRIAAVFVRLRSAICHGIVMVRRSEAPAMPAPLYFALPTLAC
jgi:hypothetical protein